MRHRLQAGPHSPDRQGAVLVENAMVMSIFGLILAGLMEFGHLYMVKGVLNSAVKRGARYGAVEDVTTDDVEERVEQILSEAFNANSATVMVKDASVFDEQDIDAGEIEYDSLPDLELSQAERGQLYVIRVTVPYDDVALLPPFWVKGATLKAQSVMRHE